ncbi:MAG: hypothetical protein L0Y61_05160 [Epsilonproteobacteria bacterium]|nr:hypothetical protein [Campylobacterota bacterium]
MKQFNENATLEVGAKYKLGTAEISVASGSNYASMKAKSATALYIGFNYSF